MRVLVVTPWFPSAAAPGSGVFNLRDAELLAQDHTVTVMHLCAPGLLSSEGERADIPGLSVVRIPYAISDPRTYRAALRAVRRHAQDADLVHTMAFPALLPTWLSRLSIPWIHTEHYSALVSPPSSARMAFSLRVLKHLFRAPTEIIAVSRSLADVIDQYRRSPTTVIANHVEFPAAALADTPRTSVEVRLIGVGGAIDRKGAPLAVEVLGELRNRGVPAQLTWIGDGVELTAMQERAAATGVLESLTLPGFLPFDEISRHLLSSDLMLLPVEQETFGVAIAEALAHGLPVVTSGIGGHREFLPPLGSRWVADREASALADAVQDLLGDPHLWSRRAIQADAREHFSVEIRRAEYRLVYARACTRASRG